MLIGADFARALHGSAASVPAQRPTPRCAHEQHQQHHHHPTDQHTTSQAGNSSAQEPPRRGMRPHRAGIHELQRRPAPRARRDGHPRLARKPRRTSSQRPLAVDHDSLDCTSTSTSTRTSRHLVSAPPAPDRPSRPRTPARPTSTPRHVQQFWSSRSPMTRSSTSPTSSASALPDATASSINRSSP